MLLFEVERIFVVILVLNCLRCKSEDENLRRFTGTLEGFDNKPVDLVFLLDESGSITAPVFPQEITFMEFIGRHITISASTTRVAVVTFSSGYREHFNYIQNSVGNNMCTFILDISKIDYKGGGTDTGAALKFAGDLLQRGRSNAEKVIILISDGKSSDGAATLNAAVELKNNKNIIFAVGVATVNEEELNTVASGINYTYVLKGFRYEDILRATEQLKKDTKELSWDPADSGSCEWFCGKEDKYCCDSNARCSCGTKGGIYECVCNPGFTGLGRKGNCFPCPKGTYSSDSTKANCKPCPDHSTTRYERSTSTKDCYCLPGYEGDPARNLPCKAVKCAKLLSPEGGTVLPDQCGNTFNSTCTFKCYEGHCPYSCNNVNNTDVPPWFIEPKEPRKCLENKTWSGIEFYCEKIKCSSLNFPKSGKHNCSGSDFRFGTICHMQCNKGYILHGSEMRQCQLSGEWNGKDTICKAVECPPLKQNRLLSVKPEQCHTSPNKYGTACRYYCEKGYELVSASNSTGKEDIGLRKCQADGKWSGVKDITCKDNSPPQLECPSDVQVDTDKGKSTAQLYWQLPKAEDNIEVTKLKVLYPPKLNKPPYAFNIGTTKVTYVAEDRSGLNATCSFQVTVKDTEDPIIEFCPNNITKEHGENKGISITWKEPVFLDNSGMKLRTIFQTHKSGDQFSWGHTVSVLYSVSDPSGNTANCSFFVTIKPYPCKYSPPPLNGAITCDNWLQGQLCAVHCEEGYNFIQEPEDTYFCLQQGNSSLWGRLPSLKKKKEPFQFPWPDCGKKSPLKNFKMRVKLSYYSGACPSKSATIQMKKHFITLVKEYNYLKGLCPEETCIPENVVVKCGQRTESGINYILNRKKRNNRNFSINGFNEWEPQFDMYINETSKLDSDGKQHRFKREEQGNSFVIEIFLDIPILTNETESSESCEECGDQYYDSIAQKLKKLQLLSVPELSQYVPGLSPIYNNTSFVLIPECDIGQVVRNMSCVNCPLGMFFNKNISECLPCPVGKFQDTEALTFCKECPSEFSTVKEKSKSIEECKKFCPPGSYSDTGLETCQACPIGTYQHLPGQTYCNICDEGTTTWKIGSSSLADCTTMCPPGTYSDTGFHPCTPCPFGTYQSLDQQTECILCADGLTTRREGAHAPEYCRVVDHCKDLMPCMNGGTCTNAGNAYICSCLDGFKGRNCEINIDDCTYNLCLNNGTCIDEINDYSCACLAGFTGQMCEININDCHSESCFHGGTCIDGINKFVCKCSNGFTGDRCEINYYDCASDPCQNGGTCFDQAGGFRCCCAKEYTGQFCEQKIQECDNIDCYNGGTCVNKFGGFECLCKEGYEGKQCERNTDDCQIQPCKNNGVCIDGISNYTCQCPPTHEGYHCEKELSFKFGIKFPEAIVSNYVKLHNKRSLSALTVSFWMRTDYKDKLNRGTPISYSFWDPVIRKEVDNALTLLDVNKFVFYLHGKEFHTSIIANSDHNWHHCVITWESISGSWLLYWDGVVRSRGSGVAVDGRFWSGYFVLGQEQDSIGTAFSTLESYKGEISQFNVWDHVLSSQSIQELKNKCGLLGNVIAWTDIHHNLHGSIIPIENIDLCSEIGECTEEDCYCVHATKSENENCWRIIPSCEPNPCARGQRCIARYNGTSECKCKLGFEGIFCQYDIDECQTNNGNCSHFCVNTPGSYYCSCPVGMRLASDKCNCIDISYCNHDGLIYLNGDTWIRKCKECQCIQGEIICTRKQCPKMECKENENEVIFPGECCGSCSGGYSSCILHHEKFHTFDNLKYSFSGNCRYSLMDDCFDGEFSVQYEDLKPKTKQKTLYLYIHCLEIQIIVPGVVFVNGDKVNIPYRSSSLVHVTSVSENNSSTLFIFTTHKIIIEWRSSGRIEIKVPPKYKKQICGLCGNFNGKEIDDFQTKQHLPARTVKDMGLSWKVNGYEHCRNISSKTPSNPIRITHYNTCRTSSYHIQQKARKQCSLLKQRAFRPCYKHIDPRPYYKLCLEDSCSCMYNEQCYCDSIMAYMAECKRNKISIKHSKSLTHCAMECRGGTVYDECGPACVETCRIDLTTSSCHNELCVPGCHCPAGMALHNGICIYKSQCPT